MSNFHSKLIATAAIFFVSSTDALAYTDTPSEAINLNNQGVNRLNKGQMDEAIDLLKEALKISPNYEMARANLGIAYDQKALRKMSDGDHESALHLFQKARYYFPHSQKGYENENHVLKLMGYNPDSTSDRINLANNAILRGDVEAFISEFQEAIEILNEKLANDKSTSEDEFYQTYGTELAQELCKAWHPDPSIESFSIHVNGNIDSRRINIFVRDFDKTKDLKVQQIIQTGKSIKHVKPLYQRQKNRLLHFLFSHSPEKNEVTFEGNERDYF